MKLARHFHFALNEIFVEKGFARVIILEDDLEIAPDFFDYFHAMAPILTTMIPSWQFLLGTTMVLANIQQILPLLCDPTFPWTWLDAKQAVVGRVGSKVAQRLLG